MKSIISFLIMTLWSFQVFTQVIFTSQGVDCYNDSGNVFLYFDSNITVSSIDWQYSPHNIANWVDVGIVNTPFVSLNNFQDSLSTNQCGLYKVIYEASINSQLFFDTLVWSLSCPLTMGNGQNPILCYGDSSGILKRPVFGGVPFISNLGDEYYFYEWIFADDSSGSNSYYFLDSSEILSNVSAGWYKTIVIDSVGCSDTIGFVEFKNPPVIVGSTIFIEDVKCRNTNTGKLGFQIFGGKKYDVLNKYFYYLFLDGDTVGFSDTSGTSGSFSNIPSSNMQSYYKDSIQFDSLMAGEYFLHVVDSNYCLLIDTIIISQPLPYQAFVSATLPFICESDSGYLYIDSILGGGLIDYGFIGPNSDSIYVSSGLYYIYIEDLDYGCIDTVPVQNHAQYEIQVFSTIINNSCFGDATGVIIIDSVIGGNIPYDIQWGGLNNNALEANNYSVIIVDSIGCVHNEIFTVTQPFQIDPNAVLFPPSCYGVSDGSIVVDLIGGTGNLIYYWLNGTGSADSLYSLSSGIYTLVIADSLMCVDSFDFFLSDPDSLIISFSNFQDSLSCFGEMTVLNLLISGGTAPFSVLWNDGDTNQLRIIGAGNYSCTVTDVNGCIASENLLIIEPESLSVNLTYTEMTCDQGGAALISIDGGVEPIDVIWSNSETEISINSLLEGIYWVVVTDSCGNSASDTFEILPYLLNASVFHDDTIYVGQVEIDTCSSIGTFSYQWVDILGNVISNNEFSSQLCEGTYFITTVDEFTSCSVIDTLIVTFDLPNGILDTIITTVFSDSNLWGNPPYTYLWDNGEILAQANICPGFHWVEVTDINGCIVRQDFVVDPFDLPNGIVDLTLTTVFPDSNLWGSSPYTYLWDNGEVLPHANICPGSHWVEVTDAFNCIIREDFDIDPLLIILDPAEYIIECNLENLDVIITAVVTGGTGRYTYAWPNGSIEKSINLGLSPGNYSVTVMDDNACEVDTSFLIATISAECVANVFTPNGDNINDTWNLKSTF